MLYDWGAMRPSLNVREVGARIMKRRVAVVLGVGTSVLAAGAALWGWWEVAVVLIAFLQAGLVVLLFDTRARMARSTHVRRALSVVQNTDLRLDNVGARILAAVEEGRVEISDRLAELHRHEAKIRDQIDRIREQVTRHHAETGDLHSRQIEAMFQLFARTDLRAAMPPSGGWAMDAENILILVDAVERMRPRLILELGGGTSSLWLGYALDRLGAGRVISIDQDDEYAEVTRANVRKHGLEHIVDVRVAPLVEGALPGHNAPWYDPDGFKEMSDIDVLVIDGPTKATGSLSRYPALPVLADRLADPALIVLDDANRLDETEAVRRWIEETPGLRKMNLPAHKNLACLVRDLRATTDDEIATPWPE